MPAFNISEFKSNISEYGILQNNKFSVFIPISPNVLVSTFTNTLDPLFTIDSMRALQFRAEAASVPGFSLQTQDVRVQGTGVNQKMPFNALFPDVNVTFLADSGADIYKYFYSWFSNIVDFTGSSFSFYPSPSYEVGYKSDYVTDISILVYDNFGNLTKQIILYEAFPDSITEIPLDWADKDRPMKFTVKFAYTRWGIYGINNIIGGIASAATSFFSSGLGSSIFGGDGNPVGGSIAAPSTESGSFGFADAVSTGGTTTATTGTTDTSYLFSSSEGSTSSSTDTSYLY